MRFSVPSCDPHEVAHAADTNSCEKQSDDSWVVGEVSVVDDVRENFPRRDS